MDEHGAQNESIILSKLMDNDKNTYMHIIAKKLDLNLIKKLSMKNMKDARHAVNMQNINGQTPLHMVLDADSNNMDEKYKIIDYFIEKLLADPSIADNSNRIIVKEGSLETQNNLVRHNDISKSDDYLINIVNIERMNEDVSKNFDDMSFISEKSDKNISSNNDNMSVRKNLNKFSVNHIDTNMDLQGSNDIVNFVDKLLSIYSNKNDQSGLANNSKQSGGAISAISVKGRRKIGANISSESDKFNTFDTSDFNGGDSIKLSDMNTENGANSFLLPKSIKNNLLNDFKNFMAVTSTSNLSEMSRMRTQRDPKLMDVYKSIVAKIGDHLGLDENDAKLYGTILKIVVGQKNPELKKPENDEIRLKEIEKIVQSKASIEEALVGIDIDALKTSINERMAERQKKREEYMKNKTESTSDVSSGNESTDEKPAKKTAKKVAKKTATKTAAKKTTTKSKVTENGYLLSDELIFSPNY